MNSKGRKCGLLLGTSSEFVLKVSEKGHRGTQGIWHPEWDLTWEPPRNVMVVLRLSHLVYCAV